VFGWPFLVVATLGLGVSMIDSRARSAAILLAAIALQAVGLVAFARSRGSTTPYLALKMMYLAIYPMAVAGAVGVAWAVRRAPRSSAVSWLLVAIVAALAAQTLVRAPQPVRTITQPLFLAGQWAGANLTPACVDYLTPDSYSAYWLHLAVLRNPRTS